MASYSKGNRKRYKMKRGKGDWSRAKGKAGNARGSAFIRRGSRAAFAAGLAYVRKDPKRAYEEGIKFINDPYGYGYRYIVKKGKEELKKRVGDMTFVPLPKPRGEGVSGQAGGTITAGGYSQSAVGRAGPQNSIGKTYKTKFVAGKLPTSSVKMMEKLGGSTKRTWFDTNLPVSGTTEPLLDEQRSLRISHGFNRRSATCFNANFFWTWEKLMGIADVSEYTESQLEDQTIYWMTKHFGHEMQIVNTNKYLDTYVKVSYVSQKNLADPAITCFRDAFTTSLGAVKEGAIPRYYQLENLATFGYRNTAAMDPIYGRLSKSEAFRKNFNVAKTFTRKLAPGETWVLDYKHHTGPGMRVDDLYWASQTAAEIDAFAAMFYVPIIETWGPSVEIVHAEDRSRSHIGTASGMIQTRHKLYYEAVLAPQSIDNVYETTLGAFKRKWAFKVYTDSNISTSRPTARRFSVPYNLITDDINSTTVGAYIIPVTTDLTIAAGGREVGG